MHVAGDGAAECIAEGDGARATRVNVVVYVVVQIANAVSVRVFGHRRRVLRILAAGQLVNAQPAVAVEVNAETDATDCIGTDEP